MSHVLAETDMSDFSRLMRVALRGLRRAPAFTLGTVLILGLGIGTAAAMFTVFRAVLVERLPVSDAASLVVLTTHKDPAVKFGLIRRDLKTIARETRTLRDVAGHAHWGATPAPLMDADRSIVSSRVQVTGNFFHVLGTRALLGRLLQTSDEDAGAAPVIVLSYSLWQNAFGGDTRIVGRRLVEPYTQTTYTIVGVAPAGLDYPAGAGYWIPLLPAAEMVSVVAVGRLVPGASASAARAELFAIKSRLSPELQLTGAKAVSFTSAVLGDVRPVLFALTSAVGLLLLIACVNVGNLLLLRASARSRELAVRRALGATYGDIVRQLLLESGLLAVGGAALGLVSAMVLLRVLLAFAPPQLPRADVIQLSGAPIAVALAVTLASLVIFGVVPAFLAARSDVAPTLRLDSRTGRDSAKRRRLRYALVASQSALALVMLSGVMLLTRSLARLERLDLGYDPEHLSIFGVSWPTQRIQPGVKLYPIGEEIVRRWRSVPGVTAVTPILIPPLLGANVFVRRLDREGQSDAERGANPFWPVEAGNDEYFRTFGIPIVRGRGFLDSDRETAPLIAIVSEVVAKRMWPNEDPIGKRIHFGSYPDTLPWRTVVGVTGNVHLREMREASPAVYVPWRQANFWQANLAIRTSTPLASVLPALRRELRAVDPQLELWYAKQMDELLAAPLAQPRMGTVLMTAFGLAALLLSAIGLYGVMASEIREGTRDIGIRMALGAAPERLRREVLGRALAVSGVGMLVGVLIALVASRLLATLLFDVSPTDPASLVAACAVLLTIAVAAAYVPARRATRIDPALALRSD